MNDPRPVTGSTWTDEHFVYEGERTRHIAFPLGGVGSGGLAISGNGRLIDWSIRNRPALNSYNGLTHFALKAESDGGLLDARVLHGPYDGLPSGSPGERRFFDGFGFGANRNSMAGVPHFKAVTFNGRFPVADLVFHHDSFPAAVTMTAFSPFIPHNDRDSAMPAALFEIEVANTTQQNVDYTLGGVLGNHETPDGDHRYSQDGGLSALTLASADENIDESRRGNITLATDETDVDCLEYLFRGQWFDDLGVYWNEFARPGPLPTRRYEKPRQAPQMFGQPEHGAIGVRFTLAPGQKKRIRLAISWYYPNGEIYWFNRPAPDRPIETEQDNPNWTYYYATQWSSSRDVAKEALSRWDELYDDTCRFRDVLFDSTLPTEIKDAASATLGLLRTQTVLRLDNGSLWAWEGQHHDAGSCEGSCTHVWNYQQAVPYLFPALERTLRETEFQYNMQPDGGLTFRQKLPQGSGLDRVGPCADGHFGAIIKTYRDWKLSGDTDWLRAQWPAVRRAIEYAWSEENEDRWDPGRTGILTGKQHHTLDMELFGPNSWLSSFYVAALLAGAEIAAAVGEVEFGDELRSIGKRGAARIDDELFNGAYYQQATDLTDRSVLEEFAHTARAGVLRDGFLETYWSDEHGQMKYQFGNACQTDQIIGQWHAELCGLGLFLDEENSESALLSIYRHNHQKRLDDYFNPGRVYAYEDEGGLAVFTWPDGAEKPAVPPPYSEEIWTGLEYMLASHLLLRGFRAEALDITRTTRARYDGSRRNPWNEMECGSYYARSMAAFALVVAWTGMTYDMSAGRLGFRKEPGERLKSFWATGTAWGQVEIDDELIELSVMAGHLELQEIEISFGARGGASQTLSIVRSLRPGERVSLSLSGA